MKRIFWGLVLVLLGLLFLVQTLGMDLGLSFWSTVLTLVGLSIAYNSFTGRRGPGWFGLALGLWLAAMGLFDILGDAGLLSHQYAAAIRTGGWPLLLIALGFSVLFGRRPRVMIIARDLRHRDDRERVIGDLRYGQAPWVLDQDLTLHTAVGDLRLDLTTADITPGAHRIQVSQMVGETVVKVPESVTVRATAEASVGDLEVLGEHRSGVGLSLYREVVVAESDAELIIDAHLQAGSIRIIRVAAPPFRVS